DDEETGAPSEGRPSTPGAALAIVVAAPAAGAPPLVLLTEAGGLPPAPPLMRNPAAVYLAALDAGSRRTMRQAPNTHAALLGLAAHYDAAGHNVTFLLCPWGALRYQHTSAVRAQLAARYAPATANKMLAALRRVLQEAWRLEQISQEDVARARDLPPIRG